jgi:hypothetical protein
LACRPISGGHLADLTQDYTVSRCPDAASAVPYELHDEGTVRTKIGRAEAVIAWLTSKMSG